MNKMNNKFFIFLILGILLTSFVFSSLEDDLNNQNIQCHDCTEENIIINDGSIEIYNSEIALNDKVTIQEIYTGNSVIDVSEDYTGEISIGEESVIKSKNGEFKLVAGSEIMVISGVVTIKNAEEGSKINLEDKGEYELSGQDISIQKDVITSIQDLKINGNDISGESEISLEGKNKYKVSGRDVFLSNEKGKVWFNGGVIVHEDNHLTKLEDTYLTSYYNDEKLRSFSRTNKPIEFYQENGKCSISNCIEDTPELIKINVADNNLILYNHDPTLLSKLEVGLINDESTIGIGTLTKGFRESNYDQLVFSKDAPKIKRGENIVSAGFDEVTTHYHNEFDGSETIFKMRLIDSQDDPQKQYIQYYIGSGEDLNEVGTKLLISETTLYSQHRQSNRNEEGETFQIVSQGELISNEGNLVVYSSMELTKEHNVEDSSEKFSNDFQDNLQISQVANTILPTDSVIVNLPPELLGATETKQIAYALQTASHFKTTEIGNEIESQKSLLDKFIGFFREDSQQTSKTYVSNAKLYEDHVIVNFGEPATQQMETEDISLTHGENLYLDNYAFTNMHLVDTNIKKIYNTPLNLEIQALPVTSDSEFTGFSDSPQEAIINALQIATEQYHGIRIDSKSVYEMGLTSKDELTTQSRGLIKSYEVLDIQKKEVKDGSIGYTVKLKVTPGYIDPIEVI